MSGAALVILNPVSGKGRATRIWEAIAPTLGDFTCHLVRTTKPGDAERRTVEWTGASGAGPIIVVGGDGTIHEVVNGLTRANAPLPFGVIPAGTGNDFARNAGIPLRPASALQRLRQGGRKSLDLGRLAFQEPGGTLRSVVFVNSCSVGVSPAANRRARRLGYVAGGLLSLLFEPRRSFRVTEAGRTVHEGRALNITMANGAGFGGGMRISPDSSPWDGVLERVIIGELGLARALLAFSRLGRGGHLGMREVTVTRTASLTVIEPPEGPCYLEADGHDYVTDGAIRVSIEPAALTVLGAAAEILP